MFARFLPVTIAFVAAVLLTPTPARAHCDSLDGPVVKAAQRALDTGDVRRALVWVTVFDEAEVQAAFDKCGALQCGFCQPGMMLSTRALLNRNPNPERNEIRHALAGNLCRCTGYTQIFEAVELAVAEAVGGRPPLRAWEKQKLEQRGAESAVSNQKGER